MTVVYVAIASFLYFGVKSLLDAREIGISGEDNAGIAEEREGAEETLKAGGSVLKEGWPLVRLASKLELMTTLLAKPTRLTPPPLPAILLLTPPTSPVLTIAPTLP